MSVAHLALAYRAKKGRIVFSPTADSFGVSAQIGSGVVWGGPEVRFHEGSTRVPPRFTRVPRGFHEVLRGLHAECRMLLGISPELISSASSMGITAVGCGLKLDQGTTGVSPCFYLPEFHFASPFLTHSHFKPQSPLTHSQ